MLSQAEIDALPTILDVVELISKMENDMLLRNGVTIFPGDAFLDEGRYTFVSETWNSKWVAAFFASTRYDYDTDTYHPVGRDYGYGVMYISKPYGNDDARDEFFEKNVVIGYQYFERPTKQSSFGYMMRPGEDFNDSPYFEKVFFRHDLVASKIVYDMSYKQRRFIPKDSLSRLARQIAESNEVTRRALERCIQMCYRDKDMTYLENVCAAKGVTIREDNRLVAEFSKDELAKDWEEWNKFGRADLESRILPIRAVTTMRIDA